MFMLLPRLSALRATWLIQKQQKQEMSSLKLSLRLQACLGLTGHGASGHCSGRFRESATRLLPVLSTQLVAAAAATECVSVAFLLSFTDKALRAYSYLCKLQPSWKVKGLLQASCVLVYGLQRNLVLMSTKPKEQHKWSPCKRGL